MTENYDLTMERTYPAPPRAVYDAFLGMYGENRPDWIVGSRLHLRPGGSWRGGFHPPRGRGVPRGTGASPGRPPPPRRPRTAPPLPRPAPVPPPGGPGPRPPAGRARAVH